MSGSAKDAVRLLRGSGFEKIGQRGSHQQYRHPGTGVNVTVPDHGKTSLSRKLWQAILDDIARSNRILAGSDEVARPPVRRPGSAPSVLGSKNKSKPER